MTLAAFQQQLNRWGLERVPFLFIVDFEMEHPQVWAIAELNPELILFDFNGRGNGHFKHQSTTIALDVNPVSFSEFKNKFERVMVHLKRGDSFLTNLTFQSRIKTEVDLKELFYQGSAKYKLWLNNQFVFYSPETFIQIADGRISTFPMKGTIDASVERAEETILSDPKELAEHITIVDLLRNDLGRISTEVKVNRFRYIDEIKTLYKTILQVSSEISGRLPVDYYAHFGDILLELLPAGSVSGAPKKKTLEIIRDSEKKPRGYYTGVAGYFDGSRLDTCVMIRFVEQVGTHFYYRSGGGITSQSDSEKEYREILDKIYVPSF